MIHALFMVQVSEHCMIMHMDIMNGGNLEKLFEIADIALSCTANAA